MTGPRPACPTCGAYLIGTEPLCECGARRSSHHVIERTGRVAQCLGSGPDHQECGCREYREAVPARWITLKEARNGA